MTHLTPAQIADVAAGAGFTGTGLRDAVAVALAESGGNTAAVGVNSDAWRSRDRGLWQINSHWHPEVSDAQAFNPASCAAAAFRISAGGTDWHQWATWPTAASAQFGRAQLAANQAHPASGSSAATATPASFDPGLGALGGAVLGPAGSLLGLLGGAGGGITSMLDLGKNFLVMAVSAAVWMANPHNWLRILMVVAGGSGILISLAMIAKSGAAGDTASAAATTATTTAKSLGKAAAEAAMAG